MKISSIILLAALLFTGCAKTPPEDNAFKPSDLTVSAAASLKDAFTEVGTLYKTKTGGNVNFNFGASGALQKQIENGAPVDVFASAGEQQMDRLEEGKLIDETSRKDFARNTLVLIVPADSKLNLKSYIDLYESKVKKIAVGNPKTVPAGQYTDQIFSERGVFDVITPKLIYAEDVRQVLHYVARGEVDAGIVYATDVSTAGDRVRVVETIPDKLHSPILYPIAIVKDSKQALAARAFLDLVLSAEGQAILQKHGFASVTAQ